MKNINKTVEQYNQVLSRSRLFSLANYITSAMLTGDIKEYDTFEKMLPIIKKDLPRMAKLIFKGLLNA